MLRRLLRYLERHAAPFPIAVLDASSPEIQEHNSLLLAGTSLAPRHHRFAPGTPLAETVSMAVRAIETPFCSLMPDDDIPLPGGLAASLAFLRQHADFVATQGYHAAFCEHGTVFRLLGIPEWCPSIDDDEPLPRLYHYARRYQPIAFAVYRRAVLQRSFAAAAEVGNLLFMELLQAFAAVSEGKIARLSVLYRLRREDGSVVPRRKVNIFNQFVDDPEALLREYRAVSRPVAAALPRARTKARAARMRARALS